MSHNSAYWNAIYETGRVPNTPSTFAAAMLERGFVSYSQPLVDVGCGNGRDSLFFASHGIRVFAVDSAATTIGNIQAQSRQITCVCDDFTRLPTPLCDNVYFGTVFSRFSIHSVPSVDGTRFLQWAYANLVLGGRLLIEARSVKDPLYGSGQTVPGEADAFVTTHYRRFIRMPVLVDELSNIGFVVESCVESANLSVVDGDNPVLIRIVALKPLS